MYIYLISPFDFLFFCYLYAAPRDLHSFPTRRSSDLGGYRAYSVKSQPASGRWRVDIETAEGQLIGRVPFSVRPGGADRSEEHTSELQSHVNLVCRLLLEKKKKKKMRYTET